MDLQGDEGTERSRAGAPVITAPFESVWPDVERRLRALLYRRGLDQPSADDVVQEVALRVLSNDVTFESSTDLLRWAAPVACRLHVDLLRHRARMTDPAEADETPARDDVAGEVADRLELQRALRAIAALRPADRDAIIDAVTAEPTVPRDRQEAVKLAVRRHRARTRLAVALEQLAAFVGGTLAGWRLLARERRGPALAMIPAAAAAIPLVVALGPGPAHERPPRPPAAAGAPNNTDPRLGSTAPHAAVVPASARPTMPPAAPATRGQRTDRDHTATRPNSYETYEVTTPTGAGVRAGGDNRQQDDRTVCVGHLPVLTRVCV